MRKPLGTKNQTILGAAFAAALLAAPAHANVLTNGSFETDVITFPFYYNYGPGCTGNCGTSITGWTVTALFPCTSLTDSRVMPSVSPNGAVPPERLPREPDL